MTLGKYLLDVEKDFVLSGDAVLPYYNGYVFSFDNVQNRGSDWKFIYTTGPAGEKPLADCEIVNVLDITGKPYFIEVRRPEC